MPGCGKDSRWRNAASSCGICAGSGKPRATAPHRHRSKPCRRSSNRSGCRSTRAACSLSMGMDTAVAYARDPLLAQLLREGLATPDPLQLGVAARPDGQLLDAEGHAQPGLYGIGSLLRGNLWECTAMPEIRTAASRLAQTLTPSDDLGDEETATKQ